MADKKLLHYYARKNNPPELWERLISHQVSGRKRKQHNLWSSWTLELKVHNRVKAVLELPQVASSTPMAFVPKSGKEGAIPEGDVCAPDHQHHENSMDISFLPMAPRTEKSPRRQKRSEWPERISLRIQNKSVPENYGTKAYFPKLPNLRSIYLNSTLSHREKTE